jgi:hypothetical protein
MYMPAGAEWAQDRQWDSEEMDAKDSKAKALIRHYAVEEAYGEAVEKLYFIQKRSWKEAEEAARIWAENVTAGVSEVGDDFSNFYDLNEIDYYALMGDKVKVDELLKDEGLYEAIWESECEDALYHEPDEAFWGGC